MSFFQKLKKPFVIKSKGKQEEAGAKEQKGREKKIKEKWFESEGKLSVDLYKEGGDLVIQSTIAGIKPEDLDIAIQGDIVTIKGTRMKSDENTEKSYYYQECYWGPFSRQIVLPEEADPSRAEATLREGIFTIRIPCLEKEKKRTIAIRG